MKTTKNLIIILALVFCVSCNNNRQENINFEFKQITAGPKHHLFGYIGHALTLPWNESGRYIVAMRTNFFKRMPRAGEPCDIVIIDTENNFTVTKVDESLAWNLQKGTMLYWNPNAPETQFFFNDRDPETEDIFTVLYDISTMKRIKEYRFGPGHSTVANTGVAPNGKYFVAVNHGRNNGREVVSYAGAVDETLSKPANPTTDGLFKVDIATGEATLIVSYDEIHTRYGGPEPYVHHTLVNRLSNRISFITRGGVPPSGNGKAIDRASVVNVEGAHNLREIPVIGAYHPEWYEGTTVANSGPMGKYDIYDVDTQSNTGNYLGVNGTFVDMDNDNAYGPNGKWFVCGTPLTNPARFDYQFFRISDSYKLTPNASTGLTSAREILIGDVRIDDAPRWNRLGNAILVGGETTDAVKTRQLAIIRLAPNTNH